MKNPKRVGLLCGGGPAPCINSVIGAATIRSVLGGAEVLGIHDGFRRLMQGDTDCATNLTIEDVSRIHFTGGSQLGTSRANPTRDPRHMQSVTDTLQQLGIDALISIGGDDTAFSLPGYGLLLVGPWRVHLHVIASIVDEQQARAPHTSRSAGRHPATRLNRHRRGAENERFGVFLAPGRGRIRPFPGVRFRPAPLYRTHDRRVAACFSVE